MKTPKRSAFRVVHAVFAATVLGVPAAAQVGPPVLTLQNPGTPGAGKFGYAVAADRGIAVVGAPAEKKVYVMDLETGVVRFTLVGPAGANRFGHSVATDGSVIVVGAPNTTVAALNRAGRAYVYDLASGALMYSVEDPNPMLDGRFGYSVDVDGDRFVVGAPAIQQIAGCRARVFDTPSRSLVFTVSGAGGSEVGRSVAVDGARVVVGAPKDTFGRGRVFVHDANTGAQLHSLSAGALAASGDEFGFSVDIHGDVVVVGEPGDDGTAGATDCGAAWVFDVSQAVPPVSWFDAPTPTSGERFGKSVAVLNAHVVVAANSLAVVHRVTPGFAPDVIYETTGATSGANMGRFTALADDDPTFGLPWCLVGSDAWEVPGYYGAAIGTNICGPATLNSTGQPAVIDVFGNDDMFDPAVLLRARDLPSSTQAFFLASRKDVHEFIPYWRNGQGHLCLKEDALIWLNSTPGTSDPSGTFVMELDLTPLTGIAITWRYQSFFCDLNPGPTTNLTDSSRVVFQ